MFNTNLYKSIHALAKKEFRIIILLLIIITSTWFFIELADEVSEGSTREIDQSILVFLRNAEDYQTPRGPAWLPDVVRDITSLGGGTVIFLLVLSLTGFLLLQKRYFTVILIVGATLGGTILGLLLKEFFARDRPDVILHLMSANSLSFPSGHSMMSTVVYLSLGALIAQIQKTRLIRVYIISIALFLSFIVGLSRIYLGVHYPSDVLAGWSVGLAWAAFCWVVAYYFRRRRDRSKDKIADGDSDAPSQSTVTE